MTEVASRRLYFAHPYSTYNTKLETEAIELIHSTFLGDRVENPNQPHHEKAYAEYKKMHEDQRTGRGMRYYFDVVLPQCDGCVAMAFLDGKVGAGVAGEIAHFVERDQPVYIVEPGTHTLRPLTEDEGRAILAWHNSRTTAKSSDEWMRTGTDLVLSIEETRLRSWFVYNVKGQERPYEEAHLVSLPLPSGFYPDKS